MKHYVFGLALLLPLVGTVAAQEAANPDLVKRGEYLVNAMGCHDCHTPLKMGPNGPEPDMSRGLSGHPQEIKITAPAVVSDPWIGASSATNTAHSGPWGVSFTANLTSDPETGVLRDYTEAQFLQMMRTGRKQGQGRAILPPMPWPPFGKLNDDDLKAIFAYLKQVPPIKNKVPDPIPPKQ
ncbi:MAG: putative lipoprotein [Devosia sp.]|uniref:c-type cytochrome n=1 Tax=Devosia sp. TaxID=1871048 RepID=UPI00262F8B21|nr:c-type cytochrome [Devosia sp.]MDB5540805.1 putative lipoprotein [Devosia sp.]